MKLPIQTKAITYIDISQTRQGLVIPSGSGGGGGGGSSCSELACRGPANVQDICCTTQQGCCTYNNGFAYCGTNGRCLST